MDTECSNQMKLLIYTSDNPLQQPQTGGDKRFEELAKYACRMFDADVCGEFSQGEAERAGLNCKYKINKGKNRLIKLPPVISTVFLNRKLIKRIKCENYDNIVVFDVPIAFPLCFNRTKNIVLLVRKDLIGYEEYSSVHRGLSKIIYYLAKIIMESVCLTRCKKVIVQCEYDKERLLNRHKIIKKKIKGKFCVQINNINPGWIVNNGEDDSSQNIINDRYFNVCFVGSFNDRRKGQDLFLGAANRLNSVYDDIYFHVIGSGKESEKYKSNFAGDNTIFYGRLDNPGSIIRKCNLMVVPSYADSCPNTVLEALYLGVAVIGSRRGGIPEILVDENSLFDADIESLLKKIVTLYKNKDALESMLEKQSIRAKELTFNWSEKIMSLIDRE